MTRGGTRDLVREGLERFAAGDARAAARLWLDALAQDPSDQRVRSYLEHVRSLVPDLVSAAEAERGDAVHAHAGASPAPSAAAVIPLPAAPTPKAPPRAAGATVPLATTAAAPLSVPIPLPPAPTHPAPTDPTPTDPTPTASPSSRPFDLDQGRPPEPVPVLGPPKVPLHALNGGTPSPGPSGPIPPLAAYCGNDCGKDPWVDGEPHEVVHSDGPGLGLLGAAANAGPPAAAPEARDALQLEQRLADLLAVDNFTSAIEVASAILRVKPEHAAALTAVSHCRERLTRLYSSKVGDLHAVPEVRVPPGEVIWLDLDHRAGFILAQVDGVSSFQEILDVAGMDSLESLRILTEMLRKGVIGVRS